MATALWGRDAAANSVTVDLSQLGSPLYSYYRYDSATTAQGDKKWTQGATVTNDYYVFTLIQTGEVNGSLNFVSRSNPSTIAKSIPLTSWGHLNNLHYDWGNNQIWVETPTSGSFGNVSNGRCFNVSADATAIKEAPCKAYGIRGYSMTDQAGYTGQASEVVNNYAFTVFSGDDDRTSYIRICANAGGTCAANQAMHSITVTSSMPVEIEDVAFDANGDLILVFNTWGNGNYTQFYRLSKSIFANLGLNTVPTGTASTIGADGSTGQSVAAPPTGGTEEEKPPKECATYLKWLCEKADEQGDKTVADMIRLVVNVMVAGIVVLGVIGILICGYIILTARDNQAQVSVALRRLINVIIGIVVFVLMAVLINLLLPGGASI